MVTSRISCRNTSRRRKGWGGALGQCCAFGNFLVTKTKHMLVGGCLPATGSLVCPRKLFMMMYRPCCCGSQLLSVSKGRFRQDGGRTAWTGCILLQDALTPSRQEPRVGFNLILRRIRETILQLSNSAAAAGTKGRRRRNEFSLSACARHILLERSLAQPRQE